MHAHTHQLSLYSRARTSNDTRDTARRSAACHASTSAYWSCFDGHEHCVRTAIFAPCIFFFFFVLSQGAGGGRQGSFVARFSLAAIASRSRKEKKGREARVSGELSIRRSTQAVACEQPPSSGSQNVGIGRRRLASARARPPKKRGRRDARLGEQDACNVAEEKLRVECVASTAGTSIFGRCSRGELTKVFGRSCRVLNSNWRVVCRNGGSTILEERLSIFNVG